MTKRQAIIATLCAVAAYVVPKKTQAQEADRKTPIFLLERAVIQLSLDGMAEDAFRVVYKGREVILKADEIMQALEGKA